MKETKINNSDMSNLWSRIAVSDRELAYMLGSGLPTARRIAKEANAVYKVGTRKLNSVSKVKKYIETVAGE